MLNFLKKSKYPKMANARKKVKQLSPKFIRIIYEQSCNYYKAQKLNINPKAFSAVYRLFFIFIPPCII